MKATYITKEGDRLDQICYAHYDGKQKEIVEAVMDANPHLLRMGIYYPAGLVIELPDLPLENIVPVINVWGQGG